MKAERTPQREIFTRIHIENERTGESTSPETTVAIDWLGNGDAVTVTTERYDDNTWELLERAVEHIAAPTARLCANEANNR